MLKTTLQVSLEINRSQTHALGISILSFLHYVNIMHIMYNLNIHKVDHVPDYVCTVYVKVH